MPDATPSTTLAPAIYVRLDAAPQMSVLNRLFALAIAAGAMAVLIVAAYLQPDSHGVGTHTQLGMQPCQFLYRTGLPCAGCGMTTSFSHFVRGEWIASFVAQPFGMILAFASAATFWGAAYCAITGKAAYRLLKIIPMKAHLWFWLGMGIFGWLWKIIAVVSSH